MARDEVLSHWHHSVENLSASALDFFAAIEVAIVERKTPVRRERVAYGEGGMLSAKREYFRLSHGRFSFDISAFPFGKDFIFSWWLVRRLPRVSAIFGCLSVLLLPLTFFVLVSYTNFLNAIFWFLLGIAVLVVGGIGAAQAGDNEVEDVILALPVVGAFYLRFLRTTTYYSEDTRLMFEETIHRLVIQEVSALLAAKGARALAPEETKPERRSPIR